MKTKTLPKLKADAQKLVNEFIRLRDEGKPCISCGQVKDNMQAGHYFPVGGYDGLRFNLDNIHVECQRCNCFDQSHLISYGINLINRIGQQRYDELRMRAAAYKMHGYKWSRSELIDLIAEMKEKIKELKEVGATY